MSLTAVNHYWPEKETKIVFRGTDASGTTVSLKWEGIALYFYLGTDPVGVSFDDFVEKLQAAYNEFRGDVAP